MIKQILDRHNEFAAYLDGIDLAELRRQYTRAELQEFSSKLYAIKQKSIAYEISKITEEMKVEEFPQLKGVHHFPVIQELDFLGEDQKLQLDKYLMQFGVGNYLSGLWRISKNTEITSRIELFLKDKGVVEEQYFALCPRCIDGHISSTLTTADKEKLEQALKMDPDDLERFELLEKMLPYICMECDSSPDYEEIKEVRYKTVLRMKLARDTSLDDV